MVDAASSVVSCEAYCKHGAKPLDGKIILCQEAWMLAPDPVRDLQNQKNVYDRFTISRL